MEFSAVRQHAFCAGLPANYTCAKKHAPCKWIGQRNNVGLYLISVYALKGGPFIVFYNFNFQRKYLTSARLRLIAVCNSSTNGLTWQATFILDPCVGHYPHGSEISHHLNL
jgi:hypothetical protein